MSNPEINKFIELTKIYGNDIFLIQGGGGNNSFKQNGKLFIKSSGSSFREAGRKNLSVLDILSGGQIKEKGFSILKPSMESDFHLEIKSKFVFHMHCLRSILITVIGEGDKLLKKLSSHNIYSIGLDYFTPGKDLASSIKNLNIESSEGLILLKNHGVIVFSNDLSKIEKYLSLLEVLSTELLNSNNYYFDSKLLEERCSNSKSFSMYKMPKDLDVFKLHNFKEYLFTPDQVIYLNNKINWKPITLNSENDFLENDQVYFTNDNNLLLTSNNFTLYEMVWGLIFLIRGLTKMQKDKSCHLLSKEEAQKLLRMPDEKYRKSFSSRNSRLDNKD